MECSKEFKVERIPAEGDGFKRYVLRGEWSAAKGTNAGCVNYGRYQNNPSLKLEVEAQEGVKMFARLTYAPPHPETERYVGTVQSHTPLKYPSAILCAK